MSQCPHIILNLIWEEKRQRCKVLNVMVSLASNAKRVTYICAFIKRETALPVSPVVTGH